MKTREDDPTGKVEHAFSASVPAGIRDRASRTTWGSWTYHPDTLTLSCRDARGFIYEVDLELCRTSPELADWIFQVNGKTWATADIVKDLLCAIRDLLDPQATLCGGGVGRTIDPRTILKARIWKETP